MGYGRALLMRDVRKEEESLQKKATKKSLWGSIGRTLGGLGVMALTGGAVNPLTLGLLTGGASFLGGAIGAKAAGGKLTGGRFFKSDRESLQKELGAFGSQNITASLKSGVQAGIGQKLKLMKSAEAAKLADPSMSKEAVTAISRGKGMDFEGSFIGRHGGTDVLHRLKQAKSDLLYGGDKTASFKNVQLRGDDASGITRGYFDESELYDWEGDIADIGTQPSAYDIHKSQRSSMEQFLSDPKNMEDYGESLYREGSVLGDDMTRNIMAEYADPPALKYGDQTVTGTYGSKEAGEYFAEDTPKVSAWDKFKDFVDVSDVVEERDLMSQIESVRPGPLPQFTASNQRWTPPGTGYRRTFNQLSKEYPGLRQSGLSSVIK